MDTVGARARSLLIAIATALAIVVLVLPLFVNPLWIAFAQGRADAAAWTGFSEAQLRSVTDAIVADLVIGPPEFDVEIDGTPVLNERERGHMRDVRGVFAAFLMLTVVTVAAAVLVAARDGGPDGRARTWRSIRSGAVGLIVALVLAGGLAVVAFDLLFEVFHRLLFAGGTYTFDPATERLVQLFPFRFWQESALAVGAAAIALAGVVAVIAHRRGASATGTVARATAAVGVTR